MAITAQQVYNIAISLIDSVTESGTYAPDNPLEYQKKALDFLTLIQTEILPIDKTPVPIVTLDDVLLVDDRLALSALPYGLAAHLLIQEGSEMAPFFNSRYEELKAKLPTTIESIVDQYDVLSGMC